MRRFTKDYSVVEQSPKRRRSFRVQPAPRNAGSHSVLNSAPMCLAYQMWGGRQRQGTGFRLGGTPGTLPGWSDQFRDRGGPRSGSGAS